jgi:hypothetical protein
MNPEKDHDADKPPPRPETPLLDFLERLAMKLQAFGEWLMGFVR